MVFAVRDLMKGAYPELIETANRVSETIKGEETRFARTLDIGSHRLDDDLAELKSERLSKVTDKVARQSATGVETYTTDELLREYEAPLVYPGAEAFKLYDTFGLPRDFIEDACRDAEIVFDDAGFDAAMDKQRQRARASWKGGSRLPIDISKRFRKAEAPMNMFPECKTRLGILSPYRLSVTNCCDTGQGWFISAMTQAREARLADGRFTTWYRRRSFPATSTLYLRRLLFTQRQEVKSGTAAFSCQRTVVGKSRTSSDVKLRYEASMFSR